MISKHAPAYVLISIVIALVCVGAWSVFGFKLSPEFAGTSVTRIQSPDLLTEEHIAPLLSKNISIISFKKEGNVYILTAPPIHTEEYASFSQALIKKYPTARVVQFESVGPALSVELIKKSFLAVGVAGLLVLIFIAFAFRKVSRPVSSWKYGFTAMLTLIHDITIPVGVFALAGYVSDASVDTLFVTAMLAVLGYSISDTIVIFDRIRERLLHNEEKNKKESFDITVDMGVRQTLRRSLFTSITTLIPLAVLFLYVPVTKWFALALFSGILAGTYSSIFFATSVLVLMNRYWPEKHKEESAEGDLELAEMEMRKKFTGELI
ncbi:MAG: protein translocase subunit SecF [Alphaproteobacteria bacterium]|nr:protein translocase subunit SecF [Alphaproteobacteria bacterium]